MRHDNNACLMLFSFEIEQLLFQTLFLWPIKVNLNSMSKNFSLFIWLHVVSAGSNYVNTDFKILAVDDWFKKEFKSPSKGCQPMIHKISFQFGKHIV